MYLGLDIGSTKSACVIVDDYNRLMHKTIVRTQSNMKRSGEDAVAQVLASAKCGVADVSYAVTTGYGRKIVRIECPSSDITEIAAIAKGAVAAVPATRTVIDIGGQDSKAIRVDETGTVVDFRMNDMCAAGTGRFIENIARIMEVPLEAMGELSLAAVKRETLTSMCAVFVESEVVSMLSLGSRKEDIVSGIHWSIARRVVSLARSIGVEDAVAFTGGVAQNAGVVKCMGEELGRTLTVAPHSQYIAALGCAIRARELAQRASKNQLQRESQCQ